MKSRINYYTTIFDRNEDGGYTVTVPSLPGLVTEGDNLESAKAAAQEAILCYLEGLAIDHLAIPQETEIAQMRLAVTF